MGRITTGVGLVSGINSRDIIDQLIALESRPKTQLQKRIDALASQKIAYTDIQTRLTSLRVGAQTLKRPSSFTNAKATSSNESVLTATASAGAAIGAYQFQVARLVSAQQTVSKGFVDFDSARVGAGTLTIEMGGGDLRRQATLAELRGGAGISRGTFRITDRAGKTTAIDISGAVTLDDVVKRINTNLDVRVKAAIDGDGLVITDLTGQTTSNLIVEDIGDGSTAANLGIAQSVAATSITGSSLNTLSNSTGLSLLNDGRGIRRASSGADLSISPSDGGGAIEVTLTSAKTLRDVVDAINTAGTTRVRAEISGKSIRLVDTSGGGGAFTVTSVGTSKAAEDLGLTVPASGGAITGEPLLAALDSTLLRSLRGAQGVTLGTISIQSRAGGAATQVDLSAAKSVSDVLKLINAAGAGVTASLNSSGNGIQLRDTSGGTGDIVVADVSGTGAAQLGIAGTFTGTDTVRGANLQKAWFNENSLLQNLNGGRGITPGKFKITNANGQSAVIDLTQGNEIRIEDVIQEINSRGINVVASINANGDGLLLTDNSAGAGRLKVEEEGSTTAADLMILGESKTGESFINGTHEKTITVTATDTLQTLQTKLNDLNFALRAQIINDGTGNAPYRLSLNAINTGRAGRVVFDAGETTLDTTNLVEAQDAAVFFGSADAAQPILITASRNQLAGVVRGVNIELTGTSDQPVTLSVTRTSDNLVTALGKFKEDFNGLADRLKELTKFDTTTNERGLLLGESTIQTVQTEIYAAFNSVVQAGGRYRILADIGLKVGEGAKVEFDEEKFRQAYSTDPEAVQRLFTATTTGMGFLIENRINKLIDPVDGAISRQNKTLDNRTDQFKDRMTALDRLIEKKRERLERQFSQLESVLSGLQSQQQAIGQIQQIRAPTSNSR